MSTRDNITDETGGQPTPRDPMIDRLHREALAERQPVSSALHRRIMQQVQDARLADEAQRESHRWHWLPQTASAALVAIGILAAWWTLRSHRASTANVSPSMVDNVVPSPFITPPSANAASLSPEALSINVGGILVAKIWPPQIDICLPLADVSSALPSFPPQPAPSKSPPLSPEWLLRGLEEPADSAQAAVADLIPPNFWALADLVRFDHP